MKTKKAHPYSMTGFAQATSTETHPKLGAFTFQVRMKSLNHRFLDIKLKTPRWDTLNFESLIRKTIAERFERGAFDIVLNIEQASDADEAQSIIGQKNLLALFKEISCLRENKEIASAAWLSKTVEFDTLLSLTQQSADHLSHDLKALEQPEYLQFFMKCFTSVFENALEQLEDERRKEGLVLQKHLLTLMKEFETDYKKIVSIEPAERERSMTSFMDRSKKTVEFLQQQMHEERNQNLQTFEQRLKEEAAFWIERRDISEEIVRLNSHLEQTVSALENPQSIKGQSLGKYLDFKQQELVRETNTLGNKAQSIEISGHIVSMKTLLEKMKEQVANVE